MPESRKMFFYVLAGLFLLEWLLLAIEPVSRSDWLLENVLVFIAVLLVIACYRWMPLSRISYLCIFLFLTLHQIGAHYTYSLVPYDSWSLAVSGHSLNDFFGWDRNQFDRLIHFFYGLLLAYPIRELFLRVADVKGFWGYFLPLDLTMSTSMLYEMIEWAAAIWFGGNLGAEFLGAQGDIWDAHKDMALASLGALIAVTLTGLINFSLQRDFAREWSESLRVKHPEPMGEDELVHLWNDRQDAKDTTL